MLLDELAHRVDLGQSLGDDPSAAQVGHMHQRVAVPANFLFANGFLGKARDGLGPGLDDGLRSKLLSGFLKDLLQNLGCFGIARVDLAVSLYLLVRPLILQFRGGLYHFELLVMGKSSRTWLRMCPAVRSGKVDIRFGQVHVGEFLQGNPHETLMFAAETHFS